MSMYASTKQIKAALRITDTVDDSLVSVAGSAASSMIERHCQRVFTAGSATRYFAPSSASVVQIDDMASTAITVQTSTAADGTFDSTWAVTDYQLEPADTSGVYLPYTRIRAVGVKSFTCADDEQTVKITGLFGWEAAPPEIVQACILQAMRLFKRLDSPLGVAGVGDLGVMRVNRGLDPDVAQLCNPFRRFGGTR